MPDEAIALNPISSHGSHGDCYVTALYRFGTWHTLAPTTTVKIVHKSVCPTHQRKTQEYIQILAIGHASGIYMECPKGFGIYFHFSHIFNNSN